MKKKKLLIASNNAGKVKEFRSLFSRLGFEVLSLKEAGLNVVVEEDQPDFAGNSYKKASEIGKRIGEITLADDSGLEVESLGGQPGVYSARFAGEGATDQQNNEKLLARMKQVPEGKRKACFRCVITLYYPDGKYLQTEGKCIGKIGLSPSGNGGFGYDPLFLPDRYHNKSMAELSLKEKNRISHRAIALHSMISLLRAQGRED
jgi:XTP/dITP diphosphohydrolase